jgi:hypothetical protein
MSVMRRPLAIATVVLVLAAVPALAQHGAGHSSGGHSGFAGHGAGSGHSFSGHASAGRSFSGPGHSFRGTHSGAAMGGMNRRNFGSSFRQPRARDFQRFRRSRHGNFAFRNCFGCRRFFSPLGYSAFYDPYWWWDSGSNYDEDREREIANANQMNQQNLEEQRQLREQDPDLYPARGRTDPPASGRSDVPAESFTPWTVLVFRDQHKQEVQNYAMVGQTLWSFSAQRTQKIPLASLDLAATIKANDEQGVTFRIPETSPAQ